MANGMFLVPEPRMDSRGHMVTRWVRQGDRMSAARVLPPPPGPVASQARRMDAREDIFDALGGLLTIKDYEFEQIAHRLDKAPEKVTEAVVEVARQLKSERGLQALRSHLLTLRTSESHLHRKMRFILVEDLYDRLRDPRTLGPRHRWDAMREQMLQRTRGATPNGTARDTADSVEKALAGAYAAASREIWEMNASGGKAPVLGAGWYDLSLPLAAVFNEHRGRATELAEWVIEHGPDAGYARAHMRGELAPALSDGML